MHYTKERISNRQLTPNPFATGVVKIGVREVKYDYEKDVRQLLQRLRGARTNAVQ